MSGIPEVLKTKNLSVQSNMDIFTSVLEPITKSQTRVNFVLRKQGILDSGSRFVFTCGTEDADNGTAFFPVFSGANSCIRSAVLRAGTRVIAETQDYNQYATMRSSVHTASQKKNIDMVLNGSLSNFGPSLNTDGKYAFRDAIYSGKTTAVVPTKYILRKSTTDCATWSVGISDLFPMMRGLQLPLFAMNEPLNIEINLVQQANPQTGAVCLFDGGGGQTTTATSYGLDNFQMHIDYLQYDDATMNGIRDSIYSETGMPLRYDDLSVTTTQIPAAARPGTGTTTQDDVVREVGSAGLKVKNVLVHERKLATNALAGDYRSDACIHPPQYNWRVNDRIIYPRAVFNTSHMRQEVEDVLEFHMSCPSCVYSFDVENDFYFNKNGRQNQLLDIGVELQAQTSNLAAGCQFYTGLNLRKGPGGEGTEVAQKNIIYERKNTRSYNDYELRELKFFVEWERDFILKDGNVSLSA
tara:strand:- start:786 stop:2189 length:1404 start_codon:yes stop_codon:yes gene_type:complete